MSHLCSVNFPVTKEHQEDASSIVAITIILLAVNNGDGILVV
jgi:hypothetical protein